MSEKSKGTIQVVLEKSKKDGGKAWGIVIDGIEYWDSKGEFKDKSGQEVEFEWAPSKDGNIKFINPVGGGQKSGGRSYGKSEAELALQKHTMAMAYAKDQVDAEMSAFAHLIAELPKVDDKTVKFLDFLTLVDKWATKTTLTKFEEISTKL